MKKENRLIYHSPEKLPEEVQTEKPRDNIGDHLKLEGLAKSLELNLNEKPDNDGDTNYEFINDKGQVAMHIHVSAKTGKYTLVEHGSFGERLIAQAEKIDGLASNINQLAKKKPA